jgi:hypothetical protein
LNWLIKICQSNEESDFSEAEHYFSIGHGDFNEQVGFAPDYIVWAYINGDIQTGQLGTGDQFGNEMDSVSGGTHGSLWGHEITSKTYKGRYEPDTGRLSIVKPAGHQYRAIPSVVMDALYNKFDNIVEVIEF